MAVEDIVAKINTNITTDYNATIQQRDQADEDIRFVDVPGGQWEDLFPDFFDQDNRPRMEFNKVHQAVYRAIGEWVSNRFRPKYSPEDGTANEADAKILNGLYRKDERSCGFECYDNAVEEMFKSGIGAWKLGTEFVDQEDPENNKQRVVFEPIFSSFNMVYWDSNAKRYDKRDAKRCTLMHRLTKEAFEEQYPDASPVSTQQPKDRSVFNWNSDQNIFIAEYYETVEKKEIVFVFEDPQGNLKSVWKSDIKEILPELEASGFDKKREHKKKRKYVEKTVVSGSQILEKTVRISGKSIPIVPLYGFRTIADGQEFFHGLVRMMKDPQRLFNMSISKLAENAATSGKRVPVFYPDEVAGLDNFWSEWQLGNKPYMLKKPHINADGLEIPGPINYLETAPLDPANAEVVNITSDFIREEMGGNPQDVLDPTASGKAIQAVIERVDMQTAILFENIAKSMKRCGQIYREIAAEIYDSQRFITLLKEDGAEITEQLFKWVIDKETGEPHEINDITTGSFEVIVDTGPAFSSRRKQTVSVITEVLQQTPQGSPEATMLYSILIENLDGEGMEDFKKFNRKQQLLNGFVEPDNDQEAEMVAAATEAAQQPGEQDALIQAAAAQAEAEARERDSKVAVNLSTAEKNAAHTQEILAGIQTDQVKLLQQRREQNHKETMDQFNSISSANQFDRRLLLDAAKAEDDNNIKRTPSQIPQQQFGGVQ